MSEELPPGRSAALQQLLDIYAGCSSGALTPEQEARLIQELDNYLTLEVERFMAYPSFDFEWPDYEDGLEEVIAGLQDLSQAALSTENWESRLALAETDNQRLLEGLALLQQAHQQAT